MIYAGVNGYLDPLPVNKVRAFEDGLLALVRGKHADILAEIAQDEGSFGRQRGEAEGHRRRATPSRSRKASRHGRPRAGQPRLASSGGAQVGSGG